MTTPKRLLKALDARDGHQCAWHPVGMCDPDTLTPQHRANRGHGGRPSLHRLSNLVWLCSRLNGAVESDALTAEVARDRGVKVRSHDDPARVPIRHAVHGLVLLTDDGPPTPITEEEALRRIELGRLYEEAS